MSRKSTYKSQHELQEMKAYTLRYNMGVIGYATIGKTSLVHHYMHDQFIENPALTIGTQHEFHHYDLPDGSEINLNIRDTAGQERFRALTASFVRDLHCIVIAFEVSDTMNPNKSINDIENYWLKFLKDNVIEEQKKYLQIWIIGTKFDLIEKREDSKELIKYNDNMIKKVASMIEESVGVKIPPERILYTSAKTGQNVRYLFDTVVEHLYNDRANNAPIKRNKKNPQRSFIAYDPPLVLKPEPDKKSKNNKDSWFSSWCTIF